VFGFLFFNFIIILIFKIIFKNINKILAIILPPFVSMFLITIFYYTFQDRISSTFGAAILLHFCIGIIYASVIEGVFHFLKIGNS
jgi:hypothetical protein